MDIATKSNESLDSVLDEEDFVIITDDDIKLKKLFGESIDDKTESQQHISNANEQLAKIRVDEKDQETTYQENDESIDDQIIRVEKDFELWTELRRDTISKLREIADYIG